MSLLEALTDIDELNNLMNADPQLASNMAEMGFIRRSPFQLDHNNATVAKWIWTEYGKREMMQRLEAGAEFRLKNGQEGSKQ